MSELKTNETYLMNHSRKGKALVRIMNDLGEWVDVEILDGTLKGISMEAVWGPGKTLRVRKSFCTWNQRTPEQDDG